MFIFLILACVALSSLLVLPLCYAATRFQSAYSLAVSVLLICFAVFLVAKQIKKHGAKAAFFFLVRLFIMTAGLASVFTAIFSGKRLAAALILAATVALFALSARFLKSSAKELAAEKGTK